MKLNPWKIEIFDSCDCKIKLVIENQNTGERKLLELDVDSISKLVELQNNKPEYCKFDWLDSFRLTLCSFCEHGGKDIDCEGNSIEESEKIVINEG